MALMENNAKRRDGERNAAMTLVKSGKTSPAEKWILSPKFEKTEVLKPIFTDGVLFNHKWGGPRGDEVVIPMGRLVGVDMPIKDFQMNTYVTTMVLPGMVDNKNWIGVVPYNITKNHWQENQFGGNQPAVITNKLLTLPYIPSAKAAATMDMAGVAKEEQEISVDMKMPWGAVINPHGSDDTLAVKPGDYVKATASGRFTKWNPDTDKEIDIVGQVYGMDLNQNQTGFLQWVLWGDQELLDDAPYNGQNGIPGEDGWGYNPEYRKGNLAGKGYLTEYTSTNEATGIPGLHDGSGAYPGLGIQDTEFKDILVDSEVDVADGETIVLNVKDIQGAKVKDLIPGSVTIKADGVILDGTTASVEIDNKKGKLKITGVGAGLTNAVITASYQMEKIGVPTFLDFKGVVGSLSILLLK